MNNDDLIARWVWRAVKYATLAKKRAELSDQCLQAGDFIRANHYSHESDMFMERSRHCIIKFRYAAQLTNPILEGYYAATKCR